MTSSTPRHLARLVALGRVGIGGTALVAPTAMTRPWIGDAAATPEARLLARAMGGRDLALGLGTLRSLGLDDVEARPWVALAGVADAVDAVVTVLAFRRLPRATRWAVLAATAGAAVISFRVATALDPGSPLDRTEGGGRRFRPAGRPRRRPAHADRLTRVDRPGVDGPAGVADVAAGSMGTWSRRRSRPFPGPTTTPHPWRATNRCRSGGRP